MTKNVVVLYFSSRNTGNCAKISEFIEQYHEHTNVRIYHISAENYPACCNCDYQCLTPNGTCPSITSYQKEVMDAAVAADLIYYVVPNYCGYPCASYFGFNERCVGYFGMDRQKRAQYMSVGKKFIIVSNTESDNFRTAMQQQTTGEPDMLYLKTGRYKKRSTAGDLMESDEAKADLLAFLAE